MTVVLFVGGSPWPDTLKGWTERELYRASVDVNYEVRVALADGSIVEWPSGRPVGDWASERRHVAEMFSEPFVGPVIRSMAVLRA